MQYFINGKEVTESEFDKAYPNASVLPDIVRHKTIIGQIPIGKWPLWAKALKVLAKPEDKGVGDVVARIIGDEKSEAFRTWYLKTFGKACGCKGRQDRWNRMYPL